MRRMYSEQELTNVIKEVFEAELASGALDDLVSDAVDAYLVDHPVDITALEGQTIAPAIVNATSSVNAPNLKLYWHSITLKRISSGSPDVLEFYYDFIIINKDPTPFTLNSFNTWLESIPDAEIKVVQGYDLSDPDGLVSYFKYYEAGVVEVSIIDTATGQKQSFTRGFSTAGATLTDNGVNQLL